MPMWFSRMHSDIVREPSEIRPRRYVETVFGEALNRHWNVSGRWGTEIRPCIPTRMFTIRVNRPRVTLEAEAFRFSSMLQMVIEGRQVQRGLLVVSYSVR